MKGLAVLALGLCALAGCRSTAAGTHSFSAWGKSRIPPPATGSGAQDEYYRPPASNSVPATATTGWRSVSRAEHPRDELGAERRLGESSRSGAGFTARLDVARDLVSTR